MLGENIAKYRKGMQMTQVEFAKALHVTQGAVSQWENNRTRPDTEQLLAIATLFCVSVEKLSGLEEISADIRPKEKTDREEFYARFNQIPEEDKAYLLRMMDLMISQKER